MSLSASIDEAADVLVVLDQKDTFVMLAAARHGRRLDAFPGRERRRIGEAREIHLDRSALSELAVNLHMPVGLLDEAIDHAQSKPRAGAGGLGREERFERFVAHLGRHTFAGIADRNQHELAGLHLGTGAQDIGVVEIGV